MTKMDAALLVFWVTTLAYMGLFTGAVCGLFFASGAAAWRRSASVIILGGLFMLLQHLWVELFIKQSPQKVGDNVASWGVIPGLISPNEANREHEEDAR